MSDMSDIFDRYPLAKPFADLIIGETEEDIEEMAEAIQERLSAVSNVSAPLRNEETLAEARDSGDISRVFAAKRREAGIEFDNGPTPRAERVMSVEDAIADARQKGDIGAVLEAKWRRMNEESEES